MILPETICPHIDCNKKESFNLIDNLLPELVSTINTTIDEVNTRRTDGDYYIDEYVVYKECYQESIACLFNTKRCIDFNIKCE